MTVSLWYVRNALGEVRRAILREQYSYRTEAELQDQLQARLDGAGFECSREHTLSCGTRPDFLVRHGDQRIAIEVKIGGSRADLVRQVQGYALSGEVDSVLAVTTIALHQSLPEKIGGKPVMVAFVASPWAAPNVSPAVAGNHVVLDQDGGWLVTLRPDVRMRFKRALPRAASQHGIIKLDDRDETARDLLWFLDRFPAEMSLEDTMVLRERAARHDRMVANAERLRTGAYKAQTFDLALPPREYQATAATYILEARRVLLADALGLGKTITAIAVLCDPSARPAVVLCQPHLTYQWEREIARFAPGLTTHVVKKGTSYDVCRKPRAPKLPGDPLHVPEDGSFPDVLIIAYSRVHGWADELAPIINGLICDEVQELRRGFESNKGSAAIHLADNADLVLGLSATPTYNYGDEAWPIMRVIKPGVLGSRTEFLAEWAVPRGTHHVIKDPEALGAYLRAQGVMVRRTRAEVGRELPPLHIVPVLVEADPKGLAAVAKDVADLARMVLDAEAKPFDRGQAARELDWKLRQATGVAKAPYVAQFVNMLFEDGARKVVVFAWHREVYGILMDLLKAHRPVMYTGSESPRQKQAAVDAFCTGDANVILISLRSGAGLDGLQYSGCNDVVHAELDWSPEVHNQGTGRVDRDGKPEPTTAWFLHAEAGSDPALMGALGVKRQQAKGIVDPTGEAPEPTPEPQRMIELAKRVLGKA